MVANKQIVTAAGPNMRGLLENYSLPSFESYGNKWGFSVVAEEINTDHVEFNSSEARAARWFKVGAIRRSLEKHSVVAWFDADVMIFRHDEDLASYVVPNNFHALALENVPIDRRYNPNTGVWVLRQCDESFEFLDEIDALGPPKEGTWMDQAAVMQALGWNMGDVENWYYGAGPGKGSKYLEHTAWLPVAWNQPYVERITNAESAVDRPTASNPHAVHFMGMSNEERDVVMSGMLKHIPSF